MARIDPVPVREWPPEMRSALAALDPPGARFTHPPAPGRPKALNALGTLAHHPVLANAFCTLNGHLLMTTTLTERHRELIILRVASVRQADYEWAQHVLMGRDAGLDDEQIARVADGPDPLFWSDLESGLLVAVDELLIEGVISRPTWSILAAELDTQQLLDVIFTVSGYDAFARMLRSLEVELDDDLAAPGEATPN
jgi:alkylhydroperoxidase family enzyme